MIVFTRERVSRFLGQKPLGCARFELCHERGSSVGADSGLVQAWGREEIDDSFEANTSHERMSLAIVEAGQEHTDSEGASCKLSLRWVTEGGRSLKCVLAVCHPSEDAKEESQGASITLPGGQLDAGAIVIPLLSTLVSLFKAQNSSHSITLQAYERALAMQGRVIEQQGAALEARAKLLPAELSAEQKETEVLKARALEKLIDLGPDIGRLGIAALGKAIGIEVESPHNAGHA